MDSTVVSRNGEQEGATRGYNPNRRGRASHHPLLAFVAEARMVANFWLRPGNAHSANNILQFLESTQHHLGDKVVGLLRADSGFFDEAILATLEGTLHRCCPADSAAAANDLSDNRLVGTGGRAGTGRTALPGGRLGKRTTPDRGTSVGQTQNGARQDAVAVCGRPGHPGLALWSFCDHARLADGGARRTYRGRSDCENRFKELKADFGLDAFNMRDFWATEAALGFAMLAYNVTSLFRQAVLRSRIQHTLSTLHGLILAVGGSRHQDASQNKLILSVPRRKRAWFSGLWENASAPPLIHGLKNG